MADDIVPVLKRPLDPLSEAERASVGRFRRAQPDLYNAVVADQIARSAARSAMRETRSTEVLGATGLVWHSPCGYRTRDLFLTSAPIPHCPQCQSTAWSTLPLTLDTRPVGEDVLAAFDAIEAACPVCGGAGWTTEADPADQTGQTPMQVQCWDAEHVVVMEQRALLQAGRPVERKHDPANHECRGGVPGDRFPL